MERSQGKDYLEHAVSMKVSLNKHVFQTDVFMKNYKKVGLYLKEVAVNEQSIRILLLRIF